MEAEDGTSTRFVPLDVMRLILLKATPLTLWSSRLVCKHWFTLISSPEFVAARRAATGGAWLATLHHTIRNARAGTKTPVVSTAWILIYNPLLNIQEKVSVPIYQAWPKAKTLLLYDLHIDSAECKHQLILRAGFARSGCFSSWNPVSGSVSKCWYCQSWDYTKPPQEVAGLAWTQKYSARSRGLMAFSASGLKFFRRSIDRWEFMGAMPDHMWQLMKESECFFVATPNYYLTWTKHAKEPEMVALFQPTNGSWTWVDNTWHSCSHGCRWNEVDPVVFFCF